jgi:hypothetical protein
MSLGNSTLWRKKEKKKLESNAVWLMWSRACWSRLDIGTGVDDSVLLSVFLGVAFLLGGLFFLILGIQIMNEGGLKRVGYYITE